MSNFINHEYKLVIIHIPKCGGSSIRKHSNIEFSKTRFFGKIPKKYLSYYKVGFCRHPIDRFISAFKMFKFGTSTMSLKIKDLTMRKAINWLQNDGVRHFPVCTEPQRFKHHAIPITHPFNCIEYADEIIRFENYEEDVRKYLVDKNIPIKIKKTNYTNKNDEIVLDKRQKEILRNYYKQDFLKFNYDIYE